MSCVAIRSDRKDSGAGTVPTHLDVSGSGETEMRSKIRIDGERLWRSLMYLARIGATEKGGVCRLALTDLDRQARDQFRAWCEEAGCTITIDRIGNIFARRPGLDDTLPPVMTGSHIDTQPTGGKFDGNYGVMAGLEVIRTLNDFKYRTKRPIEVVVWTNEEGSRFAPAMVASGVFAGVFDLEYGLSRADVNGRTIGEELRRIGYAGSAPVGGRPVAAFFEAHIEQGPILETEGKTIGVVEGVQGIRWYEVSLTGQEAHAGSTPMPRRRDALTGAARMVTAVNRIALANPPYSCCTVGTLSVSPNSRNVIPGAVFFTIDLRHPDVSVLERMGRDLQFECMTIAGEIGLQIDFKEIWYSAPVTFAPECVDAVTRAADKLGFSSRPIISGAGHDAVYLARVAPTGMIFVPCKDGISHNEIEDAKQQDLAAGCEVLVRAIIERANAAVV
jgi:beta-ureidopropionase / N-carbamoyl-L-amino-acid hydrolase